MNMIIQELGSCKDDVSLDLLASWGTDLGLTLTAHSTQEVEVDLTVELAHLYPPTPEVDLTVELAHLYPPTPEVDLTVELAHLYPPTPSRVKNTQRETRKSKRKSENEVTVLNETSSYLYAQGEKEIRYSEWKAKLVYFSCVKHSLCRKIEAEDVILEFLTWVIKEDKLKGRTHKKVHFNWVQRTMFWQWLTRLRETQGQDALSRHKNKYCRTQQEKKKNTEFHYVPSSTATVFKKRNEEGKVTSSDMYFQDEAEVSDQIDQNAGWSLLFSEVETMLSSEKDTDKELWTSILSDFFQGSFDGVSKLKREQDEAWANSYEISVKELRLIRSRVLKMIKNNPKIIKIATQYFA